MTNEIFLSITKDNSSITLFEERLFLPFFWICLLDHEMISSRIPHWEQAYRFVDFDLEYERDDESIDNTACTITISKEKFHTNSAIAREKIEKQLNQVLPLYDDFIACIESHLSLGSVINLEILYYIRCCDSLQDFIKDINREITSIKKQQVYPIRYFDPIDLIGTGTGIASIDNKEFKELAPYKHADDNRYNDKPDYDPNWRQKNIRKLIYFFISLIIIVILFIINQ
ncbi:hypothetical protein NJB85_00885 [Myroides odoratimimus]|uniref:hypothetical protein n=1 Tax=Myroides odoratimimus TaxID=76832 RepID=UPI002097A616|nr:hypothetical protein [Myroides odoratimimus]MCO7721729.1 hypothetical protein [Myroides odoratimimus]